MIKPWLSWIFLIHPDNLPEGRKHNLVYLRYLGESHASINFKKLSLIGKLSAINFHPSTLRFFQKIDTAYRKTIIRETRGNFCYKQTLNLAETFLNSPLSRIFQKRRKNRQEEKPASTRFKMKVSN